MGCPRDPRPGRMGHRGFSLPVPLARRGSPPSQRTRIFLRRPPSSRSMWGRAGGAAGPERLNFVPGALGFAVIWGFGMGSRGGVLGSSTCSKPPAWKDLPGSRRASGGRGLGCGCWRGEETGRWVWRWDRGGQGVCSVGSGREACCSGSRELSACIFLFIFFSFFSLIFLRLPVQLASWPACRHPTETYPERHAVGQRHSQSRQTRDASKGNAQRNSPPIFV